MAIHLEHLFNDLQSSESGSTSIAFAQVGAAAPQTIRSVEEDRLGILPQNQPVPPEVTPHTILFKQRDPKFFPPDSGQLMVFPIPGDTTIGLGDLGGDPIDNNDLLQDTLRGGLDFSFKRRDDDWVRIGKFYDTPKGDSFQIKQIGLQLMNPRVDSPQKGLGDMIAGELSGLAFGLFGLPDPNQQVYNNGLNTRTSAVMSGLAAIPREGILPGQHYGYDDVTKKSLWQKHDDEEQTQGGTDDAALTHKDGNRLVFLHTNKISDAATGGSLGLFGGLGGEGTVLGSVLGFLTGNGEELFSYLGGPRSKLGIGRTTHFRYTNSTIDNYARKFLGPDRIQADMKAHAPSSSLAINFSIGTGQPYFDYNKEVTEKATTEVRTYHRESRLGMGDPGKRLSPTEKLQQKNNKGEIKYSVFIPNKIDKINALDVVKDPGSGVFSGMAYRDMIRFRFEAIDNETPANSKIHSDVMVFRAFLDDVSDDFSAEHNTFKYNGRGEEFYTYKGFKRSIGISFKIAAQSRHEMMPLYRKLNFLVSNTAPDYGKSGRMKTPYMRMTVGHWMNRVPGVINSIKLSWDKDYPWEINLDGPEETEGVGDDKVTVSQTLILPHVLDVNLTFTPVHNFLPQKGVQTPFILPQAIDGAISKYQNWLLNGSVLLKDAIGDLSKSQKERIDKVYAAEAAEAAEAARLAAIEKAKEDLRQSQPDINHTDIMNEVAPK